MSRKLIILFVMAVLCGVTRGSYAAEPMEMEDTDSMMMDEGMDAADTQETGNKICPISGRAIDSMEAPIEVEYNGKTYNLCCKMCLADFNADPEKYIKMLEEKAESEGSGGGADIEDDGGNVAEDETTDY